MTASQARSPLLRGVLVGALPALPLLLWPMDVSAQRPEVELPVGALDSVVVGVVAGAGAAYALPRGEAFQNLDPGAGYEVFAGVRLAQDRQIRIGWMRTWHEDVANGWAESLYGLSAEMRWALARGRLLLRAAPRLGFLMLRAPDLTRSGPTVGAALAPQLRLARAWLVDAALCADFGTFPPRPPENPRNERPGTLWSIRIGLAWEPWSLEARSP